MNLKGDRRNHHMNRRELCIRMALAAAISGTLARSESAAHAAATWNQLPVSPIVHADGTATFQFQAAHAKIVVLELGGIPPTPMRKNAHGVWTITVGQLMPEIYSYTFTVDGTRILDPLNPWIKPNLFYSASMFMVPGHPPSLWEDCAVPHGVLHRHYYHSHVVGDNRDFYVYTPPHYDSRQHRRYPVLYLLHG